MLRFQKIKTAYFPRVTNRRYHCFILTAGLLLGLIGVVYSDPLDPQSSGYLSRVGPTSLRFLKMTMPIDRNELVFHESTIKTNNTSVKESITENPISDYIMDDKIPDRAPQIEKIPTSVLNESTELTVEENVETYRSESKFTNPDDILIYFSKENEGDRGKEKVGVPFIIPNQSRPASIDFKSNATYEKY